MKNLLSFLISCLSMTALLAQVKNDGRVEVLSTSKAETVLRLTLPGVDFQSVETPRGQALVPHFGGGTALLEAGSPDLPKFATALMIPETGNMAYELVSADFEEFQNVELAPSKGDLKRNVDPAKVPYKYGPAYEQAAFFPGTLAQLQTPFVMRDVRGQAIWLFPVQYNPATKVLRVYHEMTVRVFPGGEAGENELLPNPARGRSRTFEDVYKHTFVNYNAQFVARGAGDIEKMLVVVKDELLDELQPLLTWKRQSGIAVEVATISEIGSSEPAAIYNVVKNKYLSSGITYLLLVGDETQIKPEMRPSGGSMYSCDVCLGYMDGSDHLPEVLVGRLHASVPLQLRIMVNRILEYEKTPLVDEAQNWCATGMASTSEQGAGIGDDNQADYEQGNEWKSKHLADGFEKYFEFYDGNWANISPTPGDPSADKPGNPSSGDLTALMNSRGVSLYNYTGHGWEQGLVSGNFDVTAVSTLSNAGRYPIIIAVACCAGHFTSPGECLGEAVQRAGNPVTGQPYGAIGGFFSSDYQSWAPPMEGQDGMNQYLLDADGINLRPGIAAMSLAGNAKMITAYAQGGELMADFWNPFLEPSTMPRTRLPQVLAASHAPSLFLGANQITVVSDVEGALVSIYWQGQPIGVGIVSGGSATVNFDPLNTVGDLIVTVTQFNYIPYQGNVTVTPSAGPFVISQAIELDDASGNNDHKADFDEQINLNIRLANVGVEWANATSLSLLCNDPNVEITDGTEDFGNIEDSTVVAKTAAFAFKVANNVADGHVVNFNLKLVFSDSLGYDIAYPVKLQAPKMSVGYFTIDDAGSGNNNGRLDAGETAYVYVQTLNTGKSATPPAIGSLSCSSPWLSVSQAFNLGSLAAVNGDVAASFVVSVAADAPKSLPVSFEYQAVAGAYATNKVFSGIIVNPIMEDFENHNFTTFPWQMGGSKPWVISVTGAYEGTYCSRSGNITHDQKTVMELNLNVTEAGSVSFARKVSSEADYDFLYFLIDNVPYGSWSGTQNWAEFSFPISVGTHKLTWIYEKDGFGSEGLDKAWVDAIVLPPHEVLVKTQNPNADAMNMAVAPNPTSGEAFVAFDLAKAQDVSIEIADCLGRRVREMLPRTAFSAGKQVQGLDLNGLRPGVYFVVLRGEAGSGVLKLVKE